MRIKLKRLAELTGAEIVGDPDFEVCGLAPLEEAAGDELSFVADPRYLEQARSRKPGAVFIYRHTPELEVNQLVVPDPRLAFFTIASMFVDDRERMEGGVSPLAFVH
ncbi:MAG TPA: hypothetical protein ENF73_06525, partial [Proteobacteria bacterium]|nr:hypothetical protein [Pseudomonadota bacterium]